MIDHFPRKPVGIRGLIQGFKGNDYGSEALVIRALCWEGRWREELLGYHSSPAQWTASPGRRGGRGRMGRTDRLPPPPLVLPSRPTPPVLIWLHINGTANLNLLFSYFWNLRLYIISALSDSIDGCHLLIFCNSAYMRVVGWMVFAMWRSVDG